MEWTVENTLDELRSLSDRKNLDKNLDGMRRFGIKFKVSYGVSTPKSRALAKKIGKNHTLALELWKTGIHDAYLLAGRIDDPKLVTEKQLDEWIDKIISWDVCDCLCGDLIIDTDFKYKKIDEWCSDEREFVRRLGFALIAHIAFYEKKLPDEKFEHYFKLIERYSYDNRNFVKKAVNWALRNIGKRNKTLKKRAIHVAEKIKKQPYSSSKWIASDALRELRNR